MSRIPPFMLLMLLALSSAQLLPAAETKPAWQLEWEKTIDAAKKESKVVAGVPASAELRKSLEETFAKRFPGVEIEISTARGPTNASKIAAEHAAGVRYYDVLISGSLTPLSLLNAAILEPIEPLLILLRRYAAEAAREDARLYCEELVADDHEDDRAAA